MQTQCLSSETHWAEKRRWGVNFPRLPNRLPQTWGLKATVMHSLMALDVTGLKAKYQQCLGYYEDSRGRIFLPLPALGDFIGSSALMTWLQPWPLALHGLLLSVVGMIP